MSGEHADLELLASNTFDIEHSARTGGVRLEPADRDELGCRPSALCRRRPSGPRDYSAADRERGSLGAGARRSWTSLATMAGRCASLALVAASASLATPAASVSAPTSAPRASLSQAEGAALEEENAESLQPDSGGTDLYGFQPLTPWRNPPLALPKPMMLNYGSLAEGGLRQGHRWGRGGWYCEYLGCPLQYPLATIWAMVPMFDTVDALDTAAPSAAHRALVAHFGHESERYWDRALGGYAPYQGDREGNVEAWFDDNGWLGLAFFSAYQATHDGRWLYDAQRAFHFIATHGWDASGGGMWWNTYHPYHSGPALASDSLLGMLLYGEDHDPAQLRDVKEWVDWANAKDNRDERHFYLEVPNRPDSVNDYVQSPLIYAQYLLCTDGEGRQYCVRAGRVAATLAESNAIASGYEDNYGPEYDAIFLQWMMAYGQANHEAYWLRAAELNAAAAARHAINREGLWLSSWWGGAIPDPQTHPGMFRTMAATTSLFAWLAVYANHSG